VRVKGKYLISRLELLGLELLVVQSFVSFFI
jgi:hypothetical protein